MEPRSASAHSSCLESLLDYSFEGLSDRLEADGVRRAHTVALWGALHRGEPGADFAAAPGLPAPVSRWLAERLGREFSAALPELVSVSSSGGDPAHKLLIRLDDGQEVETVLMGYPGRFTVCLSTQAGCAMGCTFCATGQMGFARHLRPGEIVAQVSLARRFLRARGEDGPRNLVVMGMGEPLHNYDRLMHALRILRDDRGHGIGPARVSISTVGHVPGIRRLADENQPYKLAVSLHAADDATRSAMMPVNRRWPLAELHSACAHYQQASGRRIFFAWTLVSGRNDSPEQAEALAGWLAGLDAHVNLIPLNPTGGFDGAASDPAAARTFQRLLQAAGIPCTLRQRRGIDVGAGCGQLRAERKMRKTETLKC